MTFSLLDFSFTAVQNLTKSAQLFFKDHWSISVLTLGKTLQLTKRQKLEPEEPRPFPIAMQDKNAWLEEAEQAISIPPFHWEQIKACLSAPVIIPERNERPKTGEKEKQTLKSKTGYIIVAWKLPGFSSFSEMGSPHLEEGLPWGGGAAGCAALRTAHFLICEHFAYGSTCPGSGLWAAPILQLFMVKEMHVLDCFNCREVFLELQVLKKVPQFWGRGCLFPPSDMKRGCHVATAFSVECPPGLGSASICLQEMGSRDWPCLWPPDWTPLLLALRCTDAVHVLFHVPSLDCTQLPLAYWVVSINKWQGNQYCLVFQTLSTHAVCRNGSSNRLWVWARWRGISPACPPWYSFPFAVGACGMFCDPGVSLSS